jgi:EAL domain-containing protein (putative c-di-GMP-specific phosphodiesterase class I)
VPLTTTCGACRQGDDIFPFSMAFQPIIDIREQRIDGFEALVRGPGREGAATVLAQVTGENRYAFDQACRVRAIELATRLKLDRGLNINFLPNAVYEPRACIRRTLDAATRAGFPLDRLTFEIVESEGLADVSHLRAIIEEYHRHGIKTALDDFGTGYSGLSRLADLKPDILKIDRILIADCDHDGTRRAILGSLIALGREIGVKIVFEGVERAEEAEALRAMGGRFMQGFYFGRPLFEGLATDDMISWGRGG